MSQESAQDEWSWRNITGGLAILTLEALVFFSQDIFPGAPDWLEAVGLIALIGSAGYAAWWVIRTDRE